MKGKAPVDKYLLPSKIIEQLSGELIRNKRKEDDVRYPRRALPVRVCVLCLILFDPETSKGAGLAE